MVEHPAGLLAAASADAAIVRTTAVPAILVVRPNDHDGLARLHNAGAWFAIDPQAIAACFELTIEGLGMSIETDDLAVLRETTSKTLIALLWLHVPIAMAIGMARGDGWMVPTLFTIVLARPRRVVAHVAATACRRGLSSRWR